MTVNSFQKRDLGAHSHPNCAAFSLQPTPPVEPFTLKKHLETQLSLNPSSITHKPRRCNMPLLSVCPSATGQGIVMAA